MGLGLHTWPLKGKTAVKTEKNVQEAEKLLRKTANSGQGRCTAVPPVRPPPRVMAGSTASPWGPLAGPAFDTPRTLRFLLFLVRVLCLCWVILGLFLLSFLIHMASKHLHSFSYYLAHQT